VSQVEGAGGQTEPIAERPAQFLITHESGACTHCWGCVRHCPARAIRVVDHVSEIVEARCVKCGVCVTECGNGGYMPRDDLPRVRELLASGRPVVAVLASEHVAALHPMSNDDIERALERVGFAAVENTVLGEELVAAAYEQVHTREGAFTPRLRSTCPVAVNWVRRFYPQLVSALVTIIPPYIAQARLVKAIYPADTAVVYVSPCWARKDEIFDEQLAGAVDVAIGFDELKRLLSEHACESIPGAAEAARPRRPRAAKELSLTDGFPRRTLAERDMTDHDVALVRGLDEIDRLLRGIVHGETCPGVVDMLNCEGCADGPTVNAELSVFAKRNLIQADRESQPSPVVDSRSFLSALPPIELMRSFSAEPAIARVPSAEEIDEVLAAGEFFSRAETIDCGACGYDTCVEHAAAICLGDSSWEMCFPLQRKMMARERDLLKEHALLDELTGLGNRRNFDRRLMDEVARARRYESGLSLLMFDLDRFKDINDTHGHPVGDEVLRAVGGLLRDLLRTSDIPFRYGGDEFAVLLPDAGKTEAWVVAEKLRLKLDSVSIEGTGGVRITPTASIGIAAYGATNESGEALLAAADAALYRAKRGGRDRVELAAG